MSVINQELLQTKGEPLDKWSIREKLCLASAVAKSGEQNWMSVSRVLRPFADPNRPADWFHHKNCTAQYNWLLDTMDAPKLKKRDSGSETPIEIIRHKLTQERLAEIEKCLAEEKAEYLKMQEDLVQLRSGKVTMEMLNKWCREIDEENKRQEEEAAAHAQWIKEREIRKQEVERNWRPMGKPTSLGLSLKRKASESLDPGDESNKPAFSPLLTSLLKSPSQTISTSATILNTSIAGATPKVNEPPTTNPTIASILNSPHALQQLACQDPIALASDMLEDAVDTLPNLKVDDLESSLLSSDDLLPVIKNEDVEVIISNLIQSNTEEDLKLADVNVDIITNLQNEFEEYCKDEEEEEEKNVTAKIDPFEFQEDPAICDIPKPSTFNGNAAKNIDKALQDEKSPLVPELNQSTEKVLEEESSPGIVEVVEVVVEDPSVNKEVQDIVDEVPPVDDSVPKSTDDIKPATPVTVEPENTTAPTEVDETPTIAIENACDKAVSPCEEKKIFVDDVIQVTKHPDSSKRDYSRKKKEPEKDLDISVGDEKVVNAELDVPTAPSSSHNQPVETKKAPSDRERSNSPWTEDADASSAKAAQPATPVYSVPSSPASSSANFEDEREYRNWKKSIMLVFDRLVTHKYASLFLRPITEHLAPGYKLKVYRPLDLHMIRNNIQNGTIRTTMELRRDVLLMFTNATMYNNSNRVIHSMAYHMQQECMEYLDVLLHLHQGDDVPQRRETRTSEPGNKRKRPPEDNARNKKKKED